MIEKPPLTDPPRIVPTSLAWRIMLGGVLPAIGWPMLALGGFLATVFVSNSELATWFRFSTELAVTQGEVVSVEGTNMRTNQRESMQVNFVYEVEGRSYESASYTFNGVAKGATVDVEYAVSNPADARIRGFDTAPFPAFVGFTLIFPITALVLITIGYLRGKSRVRMMRDGVSAWGLLTEQTATNTRVNNQRVCRLTFTFVDEHGNQDHVTTSTHHFEYFDKDTPRHVLKDRASDKGCIVELLPGKPLIANHQWQSVGAGSLLRVLILPAIAIVALTVASQIQF